MQCAGGKVRNEWSHAYEDGPHQLMQMWGKPVFYPHILPGWAAKLWVTWFAASSFLAPLSIMSYCYARICAALRANLEARRRGSAASVSSADTALTPAHHRHSVKTPLRSMFSAPPPPPATMIHHHHLPPNKNPHQPLLASLGSKLHLGARSGSLPSSTLDLHICHVRSKRNILYKAYSQDVKICLLQRPPLDHHQNTHFFGHLSSFGVHHPSSNNGGIEDLDSFRPRAHSGVDGISRAKIKSVRQTVIIILGYVACSAPAVGFQLWSVWVKEEKNLSELCKRIRRRCDFH